ncbi:MAG: FimV/HubP family polar landmark protein [Herbaspirillum sp.]
MSLHLHTDHKFPLLRLKKLNVVVTLALALPVGAHAAELGKLTVLSSLGQPLHAEIELNSVSKEEEGALVARLASVDVFKKANIGSDPVLSSLQFSIEQRQGKQLVSITSLQTINEPFVDLQLELSGNGSRLVREYTFLLDPPDLRRPQVVLASPGVQAVAAALPVVNDNDEEPTSSISTKSAPSSLAEEVIRNGYSSSQGGLTNAPVPAAVAAKTVPTVAKPAAKSVSAVGKRRNRHSAAVAKGAKPEGGSYRVKKGDTLAGIARRTKDSTVSLDQMLVALYRANPDAFIGENMNWLRAGRILSVPDATTAGAVDNGEARATVVTQARDFNAYRHTLAGQAVSGSIGKARTAKQSDGGKITARVKEKSSASAARDKLQLSKADAVVDQAAAESAAAEDRIAADKAIAEANARVKALEKNVSDLEKLLEIKNKMLYEMSEQQNSAAATPETPAPQAAPVDAAGLSEKLGEGSSSEVVKPDVPASAAPVAEKPAQQPKVAPDPPVAKASFFDNIRNNSYLLPGVSVLVALLAAWAVVRVRNNRKKSAAGAAKADADADKEGEPVKAGKTAQPSSKTAQPSSKTAVATVTLATAVTTTEAATETNQAKTKAVPQVTADAPVAGKARESVPELPASEKEQGLEFDLSDFKGAEVQPGATPVAGIDHKTDLDQELDRSAKVDNSIAILLDDGLPTLNDIDLDLPAPVKPIKADKREDDASAVATEMSAKLDLARAYQNIGDKDEARELLEEVIRGGSDTQVGRAKDMLSKLS